MTHRVTSYLFVSKHAAVTVDSNLQAYSTFHLWKLIPKLPVHISNLGTKTSVSNLFLLVEGTVWDHAKGQRSRPLVLVEAKPLCGRSGCTLLNINFPNLIHTSFVCWVVLWLVANISHEAWLYHFLWAVKFKSIQLALHCRASHPSSCLGRANCKVNRTGRMRKMTHQFLHGSDKNGCIAVFSSIV